MIARNRIFAKKISEILRNQLCSCETCEDLNAEPLLEKRDPFKETFGEGSPAGYSHGRQKGDKALPPWILKNDCYYITQ